MAPEQNGYHHDDAVRSRLQCSSLCKLCKHLFQRCQAPHCGLQRKSERRYHQALLDRNEDASITMLHACEPLWVYDLRLQLSMLSFMQVSDLVHVI